MNKNTTIKITCPRGTNKEHDSIYTIDFIHSLKTEVPVPKLVMPLNTQIPCQIESSETTDIKIICDNTTPNNSPFLIKTDSRYKYLLSKNVKGIEHHEEITNSTITSNLDLENDIKILGIAGKSITSYTLSKTKKYEYMGSAYKKLIYLIVILPKWLIIFTNLLQIFIEHRLKVVFHSTSIIGYFLLIMSETICSVSARDDAEIIDACNGVGPLKIFGTIMNFQLNRSFLENVIIIFIIYLTNKKPQARLVHVIKNYLPVSTIADIFTFKFTVYFISIIFVSLITNRYDQMNSFRNKETNFNISINDEPYFKKNMVFIGLLSNLSFIVLLSLVFIKGVEFIIFNSLEICKKIKNKELIWIWDESNTCGIDETIEKEMPLPSKDDGNLNGYWSEAYCNLVCTPFVPTYLSRNFRYFKNKKAYLCGKVKNVNLKSELDNELELLKVILPDVLIINTREIGDDSVIPLNPSRACIDDGDFDFTVFNKGSEMTSNQKTYVQLETLREIKTKFLSTVLGTIDTKNLVYYVDLNLLNQLNNCDSNRFLPVKVKINQLMKITNNGDEFIRRNVRILLIGKILLLFKIMNAALYLLGLKTNTIL
ncbi:hypothetical protein MACJ_000611 [Theileria orientalis]|uniref:Uncharacterized protein n=1 Tax=Theileria orientalis TaxID=68886 RepID=A0A976M6N7_THEOR|nr:hypothetical protein MACJ_000611 [Theileria orientalis]